METATVAEDRTYNGWANRSTWLVHLHLTNDQGLYEESRALVRHAYDSAEIPAHVVGIVTDEQWRTRQAAEELQEHVEILTEQHSHGDLPAVLLVRDLVGQALADVEWRDIAEGLLEE